MELWIWAALAVIGLCGLPWVGVRRYREHRYYVAAGGNGVRLTQLQNRSIRAGVLSLGVVLSAAVVLAVVFVPPGDARRIISITAVLLVEGALVTALWLDEWFAARIDAAAKRAAAQGK